MSAHRARISRDTRWLLIVVVSSLIALSMLARVRFRGSARIVGPIAPVLSQLHPRSPFEEMGAVVEGLLPRLRVTVVPLPLAAPTSERDRATFAAAIRFRDGFAGALTTAGERASSPEILAIDRVTGLAVARSPGDPLGASQIWEPVPTAQAGFFVAVTAPAGQVVAQPIFVAAITASASPRWPDPLWALHGPPSLPPGTLIFTLEGALAGLMVDLDGQPGLVPPSVLMSEAERVLASGDQAVGHLDIEVQSLTEALGAATGAPRGVVVSWASPLGPAAGQLRAGDVIVDVDGEPAASIAEWQSRLDRVSAGEAVALTIWRAGGLVTIPIVARGTEPPARMPLGLRLQTRARTGARIESVADHSAAHQAGLRPGDVLTRVGDLDAPTAAQAERVFRTAVPERPVLLGVSRGETHLVIAMDRRW